LRRQRVSLQRRLDDGFGGVLEVREFAITFPARWRHKGRPRKFDRFIFTNINANLNNATWITG